jgi:hypothetical protein
VIFHDLPVSIPTIIKGEAPSLEKRGQICFAGRGGVCVSGKHKTVPALNSASAGSFVRPLRAGWVVRSPGVFRSILCTRGPRTLGALGSITYQTPNRISSRQPRRNTQFARTSGKFMFFQRGGMYPLCIQLM